MKIFAITVLIVMTVVVGWIMASDYRRVFRRKK